MNQYMKPKKPEKPSLSKIPKGVRALWSPPSVKLSDLDFPAFLKKHAELCLMAQVAHILESFNFSEAKQFLSKQGNEIPVEHLKKDAEFALKMAVAHGSHRGPTFAAHKWGNWLELHVPAFSYDCSNHGPSTDLVVSLYSLIHRTTVIP
jgi:hypothetical protein